jgi:trimeric autotransporter adhesin
LNYFLPRLSLFNTRQDTAPPLVFLSSFSQSNPPFFKRFPIYYSVDLFGFTPTTSASVSSQAEDARRGLTSSDVSEITPTPQEDRRQSALSLTSASDTIFKPSSVIKPVPRRLSGVTGLASSSFIDFTQRDAITSPSLSSSSSAVSAAAASAATASAITVTSPFNANRKRPLSSLDLETTTSNQAQLKQLDNEKNSGESAIDALLGKLLPKQTSSSSSSSSSSSRSSRVMMSSSLSDAEDSHQPSLSNAGRTVDSSSLETEFGVVVRPLKRMAVESSHRSAAVVHVEDDEKFNRESKTHQQELLYASGARRDAKNQSEELHITKRSSQSFVKHHIPDHKQQQQQQQHFSSSAIFPPQRKRRAHDGYNEEVLDNEVIQGENDLDGQTHLEYIDEYEEEGEHYEQADDNDAQKLEYDIVGQPRASGKRTRESDFSGNSQRFPHSQLVAHSSTRLPSSSSSSRVLVDTLKPRQLLPLSRQVGSSKGGGRFLLSSSSSSSSSSSALSSAPLVRSKGGILISRETVKNTVTVGTQTVPISEAGVQTFPKVTNSSFTSSYLGDMDASFNSSQYSGSSAFDGSRSRLRRTQPSIGSTLEYSLSSSSSAAAAAGGGGKPTIGNYENSTTIKDSAPAPAPSTLSAALGNTKPTQLHVTEKTNTSESAIPSSNFSISIPNLETPFSFGGTSTNVDKTSTESSTAPAGTGAAAASGPASASTSTSLFTASNSFTFGEKTSDVAAPTGSFSFAFGSSKQSDVTQSTSASSDKRKQTTGDEASVDDDDRKRKTSKPSVSFSSFPPTSSSTSTEASSTPSSTSLFSLAPPPTAPIQQEPPASAPTIAATSAPASAPAPAFTFGTSSSTSSSLFGGGSFGVGGSFGLAPPVASSNIASTTSNEASSTTAPASLFNLGGKDVSSTDAANKPSSSTLSSSSSFSSAFSTSSSSIPPPPLPPSSQSTSTSANTAPFSTFTFGSSSLFSGADVTKNNSVGGGLSSANAPSFSGAAVATAPSSDTPAASSPPLVFGSLLSSSSSLSQLTSFSSSVPPASTAPATVLTNTGSAASQWGDFSSTSSATGGSTSTFGFSLTGASSLGGAKTSGTTDGATSKTTDASTTSGTSGTSSSLAPTFTFGGGVGGGGSSGSGGFGSISFPPAPASFSFGASGTSSGAPPPSLFGAALATPGAGSAPALASSGASLGNFTFGQAFQPQSSLSSASSSFGLSSAEAGAQHAFALGAGGAPSKKANKKK